ncbi:MAG: chorismate synthase [Deltaproteobacteria bacterium]|jgi:chorismate synthase|nr:chorismate synthase [Deltaproteobacteria bacterium]
MTGSTFGKNLRVATFGESHGPGLGCVVDGLPAGLKLSEEILQKDLDRRRPGASPFATARKEGDRCEILSGLTADGFTNGAPLAVLIRNSGHRSSDYAPTAELFRPGHADWTYFTKYGVPPQPGGGRASGRETAARVAAGAAARALLALDGVAVRAGVSMAAGVKALASDYAFSETDPLRFLDPGRSAEAQEAVRALMAKGDSAGSVVELEASGVPAGWGEPVFGKLEALLGGAYFSIGAVRAVEFGEGIRLAGLRGSEANDPIGPWGPEGPLHGGITGGISTGRPVTARLWVRPTPSVGVPQLTVDLDGNPAMIEIKGRHDPCIGPRLAPVAEAMTLLVLADMRLECSKRIPEGA